MIVTNTYEIKYNIHFDAVNFNFFDTILEINSNYLMHENLLINNTL